MAGLLWLRLALATSVLLKDDAVTKTPESASEATTEQRFQSEERRQSC